MKNTMVKSLSICLIATMISGSIGATGAGGHITAYAAGAVDFEALKAATITPASELAHLQDDVIEWDELQGLVHNYNPTIAEMWNKFRKNDAADAYDISFQDALIDIENEYSDAVGISELQDATAEQSYKSSIANADTAVVNADRKIVVLTDTSSEATMTAQLQKQLISIYTSAIQTQLDETSYQYQKTLYDKAQRLMATGQSTTLDVLTQEKAVKDAEIKVKADKTAETKAKQTLLVNLGWAYNATPQICAVPMPSAETISAINPANDVTTAMTESYALTILDRKLSLSQGQTSINTYSLQRDNTVQQIQSDITTKYQAIMQSVNTLNQNRLALANASQTYDKTARSYGLGAASQRDLEGAKYAVDTAQYAVSLQEYAVASAYYDYLWCVHGLAGAGN